MDRHEVTPPLTRFRKKAAEPLLWKLCTLLSVSTLAYRRLPEELILGIVFAENEPRVTLKGPGCLNLQHDLVVLQAPLCKTTCMPGCDMRRAVSGLWMQVKAGVLTQAQSGMDLEERPVFLVAAVSRLHQYVTHLSGRSSRRDPHRFAVAVLAVHLYQLHTGRCHQHTHKNRSGPSSSPQYSSVQNTGKTPTARGRPSGCFSHMWDLSWPGWTFGTGVVLVGQCEHKSCRPVRPKQTHSSALQHSCTAMLICYARKWSTKRWSEQQVTHLLKCVCVLSFISLDSSKNGVPHASHHGNMTLCQWFSNWTCKVPAAKII